MEIDFWWLLALPLFFGLGWMAARIDIRQLLSESRTLPVSYFKGLNFLMNEQPDKAIEAFLEVAKIDSQTTELHFALGHLFRRRGEITRAIRMHQNLLERPDLEPEERLAALFEIAQDYLKAGLLDRAEESLLQLTETAYAEAAYKFLLDIYQQEKDWGRAIETARKLGKLSGQSYQLEISNFYCELAAAEMLQSRNDAAKTFLDEALSVHRRCVRASMLAGDIEFADGRFEAALECWKRIETQSPPHLSLVGEKILNAYRQCGKSDEGLRLLKGYLTSYPSVELLNVVFDAMLRDEGPDSAYQLVLDELKRNPNLLALEKLVEARLFSAPIERRQDLELVKTVVNQHSKSLTFYRCDSCGFKTRQFYWHCPACGGWETYPPRQAIERENPL